MKVFILSQGPSVVSLVAALLLQATNLPAKITTTTVEQLEEALNTALVRCDAARLGRLWDDQLTFVFPNGNLATKSERLAGLATCTPGSPGAINESVDVKVYGDVAVAIVLSKWTGTAEGKPFAARFRATHVWTAREGRPVLVSAHVSQMKE